MWEPPRAPTPMPQVICAVCEAVQPPAWHCAECGMPLKLPRGLRVAPGPTPEPMPDLERTGYEAVGAVMTSPVPDVEVTVADRIGDVGVAPMYDFEPTIDPTMDLELPPPLIPDLETTVDTFERTPLAPPSAACPYCGHVQPDGKICDNCGRAKSRLLDPSNQREEPSLVRCRGCGAIVQQTALCSECGQPLPSD